VVDVAFTPDSRRVLSLAGGLRIWNVETGELIRECERFREFAGGGVAVSPDGSLAATGHSENIIRLTDTASGQVIRTITAHTGDPPNVRDVAFSPDGHRLLSGGGGDDALRMWDVETGQELLKLENFESDVCSVAFSPDGARFACVSGRTIHVWDAATRAKIKDAMRDRAIVITLARLAYSKDGRYLVTIGTHYPSLQSDLSLWDADTLTLIRGFEGHTGTIASAVFSPDGRMILSGSEDKTLRVWDVETGKEIARHEADSHYTNHVAVSPDGRYIVSGGGKYVEDGKGIDDGDHALRLFRMSTSDKRPAATAGEPTTDDFVTLPNGWRVGKPVNLGPVVNHAYIDMHPFLSADGLTLLFSSTRAPNQGVVDLWTCTRATVNDPFGEPVTLGPVVNSSVGDSGAALSADGLTLLFDSYRPGGEGREDLWECTRASSDEPWGAPVNLGPVVNCASGDTGPALSADGLTLVFCSYRDGRGHRGGSDLWMCTRGSLDGPFGQPVNLGAVNSTANELGPALSADGLAIFFYSTRPPGGKDAYDLWMSTRASLDEPFGEAVHLGRTVNSEANESDPAISADGRMLLFQSDRPGGQGLSDLWMAPIEPPTASQAADSAGGSQP